MAHDSLTTRTTAEVELWASLESQLNRSQLLRDRQVDRVVRLAEVQGHLP